MMKPMNDSSNGNSNSNNNSNDSNSSSSWLGFSLSPHMKMEVASSQYHHETQSSPVVTVSNSSMSTSMYLPPQQHLSSSSALCYPGGIAVSSGFHPPPHHLTVMPIKSDGSLCIMEALSRSQSQGMVPSSPPKLENFLGGATLQGAHHHHQYGSHERETMPLSLDSIYYQQNEEQEEANRVFQQHQQAYYSAAGGIFQAPMVEGEEGRYTNPMAECSAQISQMANWVARSYPTHQGMEQNMGSSANGNSNGNNHHHHTMVENGCCSTGSMASMGCGDLQSLTLSMSPGSQSSSVTPTAQISPSGAEALAMETKKRGPGKVGQKQPVHRKSIDTFGQRTSQYRGVTKHRWTGRYEAHLWDNSCKKEGQTRKGRQVYLGGYDMEEKAARAYDLAALKYWGPSTHINFPLENYKDELEEMKNMSRQEYVAHLRRKSSGFSRGASMYRGVTRHHQHGRWQARIGRVAGNKDLYLGTFSTQEEAAEAYDIAAIKFRGVNAVTNFDITRYDVDKIMSSNTLLAGEQAKRIKSVEPTTDPVDHGDGSNNCDWKMVLCDYSQQQQQQQNSCVETTFDQHKQDNNIGVGNYQGSNFSVALQDLIGINSLSSAPPQHHHQSLGDESNKMGSVQFSNASSIVTSLNSSREGSPDKGGSSLNMMFPKAPIGWITPAQLRPPTAIPMAHLPGYAAWNDA